MNLTIIIDNDAHGYQARCAELKGFACRGASLDEVMARLRTALEQYWGNLTTDEHKVVPGEETLPYDGDVQQKQRQ